LKNRSASSFHLSILGVLGLTKKRFSVAQERHLQGVDVVHPADNNTAAAAVNIVCHGRGAMWVESIAKSPKIY
jgi:hypothetical protein